MPFFPANLHFNVKIVESLHFLTSPRLDSRDIWASAYYQLSITLSTVASSLDFRSTLISLVVREALSLFITGVYSYSFEKILEFPLTDRLPRVFPGNGQLLSSRAHDVAQGGVKGAIGECLKTTDNKMCYLDIPHCHIGAINKVRIINALTC